MENREVSLREYLESLVRKGDERLELHITAQFEQVRAQYQQVQTALISADKLELARLANLERQITLQLAARDQAIEKAEAASEKRFESVNEFRGQLSDQATRFLPREVYDAQHGDLVNKVNANTTQLDQLRGQAAGSRAVIGAIATVAVILISLISIAANYITSH